MTALVELSLSRNQIEDLSPPAKLTALKQQELAENQIEDVRSLSALTNLEKLNLRNNPITDVFSLTPLTKASINLHGNDQIPRAQMDQFKQVFRPTKCRK